jgi:type I restriction enzyme M protein
VLDPACGTAGFLISAYKHILEKHTEFDKKTGKAKSTLTPIQRQKIMKNFVGYDIDSQMVKLSRVNMYLHRFKNPQIHEYDALSREERWGDKFSVILANPPFMSPKGGIKPHSRFSVQSNRSEVLFVDYFIEHLKQPSGRAGMIVPEGIIFQSGTAHKQLRKNLIDDGLYAVVSLPPGIFSPYSGVKTSVLFFDNNKVKKEKKIIFVKVQHDGTDLGTRKRAVESNDLPVAKSVIEQFRDGKFKSSSIAHVVSKEEILKTDDYNLSGDRYRKQEVSVGDFDKEKLVNYLEESTARVGKKSETIPVWSVSNKDGFVLSDTYFEKRVASADTANYKIVRPGSFAYNPSRINVGSLALNDRNESGSVSPMYVVFEIKNEGRLLPAYLYFLLKSDKFNEQILRLAQGSVRQQLRFKDLVSIEIPVPPLEIQTSLVKEASSYKRLAGGAQEVIDNWKPKIEVEPAWKKVKLGSLIKDLEAGVSVNSDNRPARGDEKGVLKTSAVTYGTFDPRENKKILDSEIKRARVTPRANSIIISRMNTPQLVGASAYVEKDWENLYLPDRLWQLIPANEDFSMRFLFYVISSENFRKLLTGISGGTSGSMKNISKSAFLELEVSLPSREVQEEIVAQIETERNYIESTKKLIEIYEKKMTEALQRVWK